MSTFPKYRLYESDGSTLVYDFECVVDDAEGSPFFDPADFVEHTSLRSQGSQISQGSSSPFDITLTFILTGDDYENLVSQMQSVTSSIAKFTKYILKIDLTTGGSTKDIKCMRLQNIRWPLNNGKKRIKFQTGIITFRALTWA